MTDADRARADAAAQLARHANLITTVKRDSAELHRAMEAHGRAISEWKGRDMADPKVHPPK